ncbi:hypothetical protein [Parasitella parasitica]|uniref:Uncharacterized protein n=1 Tax=Parasitella parasitica TaxID=35722 RepID=A0A0B7NFX8_9FUNG|nr:hypothetical protein [Parasitella parasitica]
MDCVSILIESPEQLKRPVMLDLRLSAFYASRVIIWGVDPGFTDIYTAADSGDERIRRTSNKEYCHMCGFNLPHATSEQQPTKVG